MAEQMQPKVGIGRARGGDVEVDLDQRGLGVHRPQPVSALCLGQLGRNVVPRRRAQLRRREVGVEDPGALVHRGQPPTPGRAGRADGGLSHAREPTGQVGTAR